MGWMGLKHGDEIAIGLPRTIQPLWLRADDGFRKLQYASARMGFRTLQKNVDVDDAIGLQITVSNLSTRVLGTAD